MGLERLHGTPHLTKRRMVCREALQVAALSCWSPGTQVHMWGRRSQTRTNRHGVQALPAAPESWDIASLHQAPVAPACICRKSPCLCSFTKDFPPAMASHSGTAGPWALLRWLRGLGAAFCLEEQYSWPDMKGEIVTAHFLQAAYPD